jgi:hypothetical protein
MNKKLVGIGLLLITLTVFMSCDLFFDSTRPKSVVSISIKKLPDKIEYLSSEKFGVMHKVWGILNSVWYPSCSHP